MLGNNIKAQESDIATHRSTIEKLNGELSQTQSELAQSKISENALKDHVS